MSEDPGERPRTWLPVAGAAGIAVLFVVGALVWSALAGGASPAEQAAIVACEAALDKADAPAIVGGDVYESPEWRDYYAIAEAYGEVPVPLEEMDDAAVASWEDGARAYEEDGDGFIAIVWKLEDDTYRQCVLPVTDGEVATGGATVADVGIAQED
ncbi:hypothetical protein [Demequina sp.]|uniref:hypothetical protein n=1 Tax=Demequina sp. TaxID=2050685 RepID=UPI003A87A0EF